MRDRESNVWERCGGSEEYLPAFEDRKAKKSNYISVWISNNDLLHFLLLIPQKHINIAELELYKA
jgi:hypothetical protein